MNRILVLCLSLFTLYSCNRTQKNIEEKFPQNEESVESKYNEVEISNGIIKAGLRLPDPENGYYRGVRFDWAGDMPYLEYDGHSYFGEWSDDEYSPTNNDAIMGPVEVFNPIGYNEVGPAGKFLKIGIGMVIRPDTLPYHYRKEYTIADHGTWNTKIQENAVTFEHVLQSDGYGYQYEKVVELPKNRPELILKHVLKNTGEKTIKTHMFNHNLFVIDNQRTGPDFKITLGFQPTNSSEKFDSLMRFNGNDLEFKKVFDDDEGVFIRFVEGFTDEVKDYDIRIENKKTGAGVRITSDRPIEYRFLFWISHKTINPEPYITMEIDSGETYEWTTKYEFYSVEIP